MIDYYPYQDFHGRTGWICPKCGKVYSPDTPMCFSCGGDKSKERDTIYG